LPVPDVPGLRPTPDRVRETLFNWLGQDLSGWRVLDAFAGSGALGLEAASRGAAAVLLIEADARIAKGLQQTVLRLGGGATVQVLRADALPWMARAAAAGFELVLLDPPFGAGLSAAALAAAAPLVVPGGFVYLEDAGDAALAEPPAGAALLPHRSLRAGAVRATLWRRAA
jgi:16S rRNA (guanine966-N2)-methyltransferase